MLQCKYCGYPTRRRNILCEGCHADIVSAQKECGVWKVRSLIAEAVRAGDLLRATEHACVDCGERAKCYDHRYYSRPFDIQPVCRRCNHKRGMAWDLALSISIRLQKRAEAACQTA